ncbi:Undecaprenyl-diphosphatase [uncultured archaeon]|nr:Undecaprenyl-diphosphatase [uncultured archaeon]
MTIGPVQFLFNENINIYFQSIGNPFIDFLFLAITTLISEPGFMLLASLLFWCFDKKTGIRLVYVTLFCAFAAIFIKSLFGLPRPPEYLHKIYENGFGFPSGHALASSGFWGYLGGRVKNKRVIAAGAVAIIAVSLSRVYLGVHYAGDVVGGILIGLLIAFVLLKADSCLTDKFNRLDPRLKYAVAIILPGILAVTSFFQKDLLKERIEIVVVMASVGVGYLLEEDRIRFKDARNNRQRLTRAFAGVIVLGGVYLFSSFAFPDFIFFNYAVLGLTSTFIVPMLFARIEAAPNI